MDLGKLRELSVHRKCLECGAEFEATEKETALAQYADHSVIHQPDGEQWKKAYEMIQESREKSKKQAQDPT